MSFKQFTLFFTFGVAWLAAIACTPASASPQSDVMVTVHQFVDGFNRGDDKSALATCANPASIIDEFPPHSWQGPTACADWLRALTAGNAHDGITGGIVTLSPPWRVDVTGDRAYVVVPATYAYKQHGKPEIEKDSILTIALRRVAAGWRISGWAWSKR
jgi:hypothetical protein